MLDTTYADGRLDSDDDQLISTDAASERSEVMLSLEKQRVDSVVEYAEEGEVSVGDTVYDPIKPRVYSRSGGYALTKNIVATSVSLHPVTPEYPMTAPVLTSTGQKTCGGHASLIINGAHALTAAAFKKSIQFSNSPGGGNGTVDISRFFDEISHLFPRSTNLGAIPRFYKFTLGCNGVKVCEHAHDAIKGMSYSGAFPDYDQGVMADVQVAMDEARDKRQGSSTHQFYREHVKEWACKCGNDEATALYCEARPGYVSGFVGCSEYSPSDPPSTHSIFPLPRGVDDNTIKRLIDGEEVTFNPYEPIACRTVLKMQGEDQCPEVHYDTNKDLARNTMKKMPTQCECKFLVFYPVDPDFPYSLILCRHVHNHPPPPPSGKTAHLDTTIQQLIGGLTDFDERVSAKQRFAALALMRSRDLALHPSLVRSGSIRNNLGPKLNNVVDDQLALMQMLVSSGRSKYLQEVVVTDQDFFSFAMLNQGAHALSRGRVIDIDMTFACTRSDVNMIKCTVYDETFRRTVTVARAWVKGQGEDTYKRFMKSLCSAYQKYLGDRLQFGAFRWVREAAGVDVGVPKHEIVAIRVDMDSGQAKGIGEFALEREPLIGDDWQDAVGKLLVICTVHFGRNVGQTGFSEPTKRLMLSLSNARTRAVYDDILEQLLATSETYVDREGNTKTIANWVQKYSLPWVRAGLSPAYTGIPLLIHADIRPDTNVIESSNARDHKVIGTGLPLPKYVTRAYEADCIDYEIFKLAKKTGIPTQTGSSATARDAKNAKRRQARAAKRTASDANTEQATSTGPTTKRKRTRASSPSIAPLPGLLPAPQAGVLSPERLAVLAEMTLDQFKEEVLTLDERKQVVQYKREMKELLEQFSAFQ
ncbi:hypothetical protein BCR44DRAFT_58359 [Catenaria anguillulae PL171]|uniref:Uncharacterized protein n=1 Tax=Catenaria anguillulae PL171 TaxID=765915 RepID=A0A1Y2H4J5_9FUNG|nr:hypothetical protein BCR44DRAFT_58359 [Catenaria anguillulae PL171]